MKKLMHVLLTLSLTLALTACGGNQSQPADNGPDAQEPTQESVYHIGICNYVDDASLNQINENIQARLTEIGAERSVTFMVDYNNPNGDAAVMNQIISNFLADEVDLMVGIATPVAMAMQAAAEDSRIPVVFSAVSDPVSAGLVDALDAPGANITGTSDYLDTNSIMNLIFCRSGCR